MTLSRVWNRWFQDSNMERRDVSQQPPITSSREDRYVTHMVLMDRAATSRALSQELRSFARQQVAARTYQDGRIRVQWHRSESTLAACIRHRHTGPSPSTMLWGAIGYMSLSPLIRIDGPLNSALDISENVWSMVAERLSRHHRPVTTVDELWYRVERAWSSVPVHAMNNATHCVEWLVMLTAVPLGLDSNPGESMDVCKCIVPLRHEGTLYSRLAASLFVKLVEGEERSVFSLKIGRNRAKSYCHQNGTQSYG
ncbi:uncharacterized protein TNCV_3987661 [Trichonephila clavipes]|nr:uncharacterized protein TNCV_3987661 [Trichonephila clavipes]